MKENRGARNLFDRAVLFIPGIALGSLAWACALVAILVSSLALGISVRGAVTSGEYRSILSHQTLTPFITNIYAVIGALVASRHPRNPIGWIFAVVGLLYASTSLATAVSVYGSASSPLYGWAVWLNHWIWIPAMFLPITFVVLIFPGSSLPSPRWRFVTWSAALGLAMVVLGTMLQPETLPLVLVSNRFGFLAASPLLDMGLTIGMVLLINGTLGSMASFFGRFRRSVGIEREQMKWLAYALGISVLIVPLVSWASFIWPENPWVNELSIAMTSLAILGIAVAAAIAILRHRLWDIDILIRRTLVYSILTASLTLVFYGSVVVLQNLFTRVIGHQTPAAMVISTLASAVLFTPSRQRIQTFIDWRFYRQKYDAERVLADFNATLQEEVELEQIINSMLGVVGDTMQSVHLSLWLLNGDTQTIKQHSPRTSQILEKEG